MTRYLHFRSEDPAREPEQARTGGGFRAGDAVTCRVRRCESSQKEGDGFTGPRIEQFDGVLEAASLWQPFWWVKTGTGLKYVWNDELERKQNQ